MKNAEILKGLDSPNQELIKSTFEEIKNNGDTSMISSLLDYIETSNDDDKKESIISLLSDIKRTEIREKIIEKIKSTKDTNLQIALLRVCWESPVDFSSYYSFFTELFANNNFMIAFEAHTNIDEILVSLNSNQRSEIKDSLLKFELSEEKKHLINDIIYKIDNFIEDAVVEDAVVEDSVIEEAIAKDTIVKEAIAKDMIVKDAIKKED